MLIRQLLRLQARLVRIIKCQVQYGNTPPLLHRRTTIQQSFLQFRCLATKPHDSQESRNNQNNCSSSRPGLPPGQPNTFLELVKNSVDADLRKAKRNNVYFYIPNLPKVTDHHGWSKYLSVIGFISGGSNFSEREMPIAFDVKTYAFKWMSSRQLDEIGPVDFFNFICFLRRSVEWKRDVPHEARRVSLPAGSAEFVFEWLLHHFENLDPDAFFLILKRKVTLMQDCKLLLNQESNADCVKILAHGVRLAKNAGISDILQLFFIVDCYGSQFIHSNQFRAFSNELIEILRKRELPVSLQDLYQSLQFLGGSKTLNAPVTNQITEMSVFRRYAESDHLTWLWLRRSLELIFAKDTVEKQLIDVRQLAAVVVVRAYNWKAIQISASQLNSYLMVAADPILSDPAYLLAARQDVNGMRHSQQLLDLVLAIRSAANTDLPALDKLTVRLTDEFWEKLFDLLQDDLENVENHGHLLYVLRNYNRNAPENEKAFIGEPINEQRRRVLMKLVNRKMSAKKLVQNPYQPANLRWSKK